MKLFIVGHEHAEGVSKKTGKPYAIGKLHANIRLTGDNAVGAAGTTYMCEPVLLQKLKGVSMPALCEVEIEDVIRYGERRQEVVSVVPLVTDSKKAA
jgi:CTX phage RstB protein